MLAYKTPWLAQVNASVYIHKAGHAVPSHPRWYSCHLGPATRLTRNPTPPLLWPKGKGLSSPQSLRPMHPSPITSVAQWASQSCLENCSPPWARLQLFLGGPDFIGVQCGEATAPWYPQMGTLSPILASPGCHVWGLNVTHPSFDHTTSIVVKWMEVALVILSLSAPTSPPTLHCRIAAPWP